MSGAASNFIINLNRKMILNKFNLEIKKIIIIFYLILGMQTLVFFLLV